MPALSNSEWNDAPPRLEGPQAPMREVARHNNRDQTVVALVLLCSPGIP